ncbi:hypothetical protein OH77DRAFT_1216069 [Trametes cingulata]|nr:hypothetical protein OH77DRAFT_1216069 [Trametes cingulata]
MQRDSVDDIDRSAQMLRRRCPSTRAGTHAQAFPPQCPFFQIREWSFSSPLSALPGELSCSVIALSAERAVWARSSGSQTPTRFFRQASCRSWDDPLHAPSSRMCQPTPPCSVAAFRCNIASNVLLAAISLRRGSDVLCILSHLSPHPHAGRDSII